MSWEKKKRSARVTREKDEDQVAVSNEVVRVVTLIDTHFW